MAQIVGPNYFRLPNILGMILTLLLLGIFPICMYFPDKIPYGSLGPLGSVLYYMAHNIPVFTARIFYVIVAVHIMEALYAFSLSGKVGIEGLYRVAWFISTLIFGIGSLRWLLKARADMAVKHKV
ncbi:transmembrane protein 254-like [Diadema antillarum]|uniref:transmembrane protein 254-like n=1 Tax=Diadema antillarum TaxID=105358 RepID=UPI003A851D93